MMTREQLLKALKMGKIADIDWKTFRFPKKIAKYRLAFPRVSRTVINIFSKLIEDGSIWEDKLPYKTMVRLYREVVELGLPKNFILKKHPKIGYGVFTHDKIIKPKTILGIYTGKLLISPMDTIKCGSLYIYGIEENVKINKLQYDKLMEEGFIPKTRKKFNPEDTYEITVDAQNEGNWTRFINHSDRSNCAVEFRRIEVFKGGFIILPVIISKKKILPHTQVTTNYGAAYWKAVSIKKRHVNTSEFTDLV
jgi:hypothetical protein